MVGLLEKVVLDHLLGHVGLGAGLEGAEALVEAEEDGPGPMLGHLGPHLRAEAPEHPGGGWSGGRGGRRGGE